MSKKDLIAHAYYLSAQKEAERKRSAVRRRPPNLDDLDKQQAAQFRSDLFNKPRKTNRSR